MELKELRSTYEFRDYYDWDHAHDAVAERPDVSSKLEWGSWSGYDEWGYYVKLYDNLTQEELEWAVSRIREHGGRYLPKNAEEPVNRVCPNCGKQLPGKELFCPYCGMRIFEFGEVSQATEEKQEVVHPASTQTSSGRGKSSFRNFEEWCDYWADTFVRNQAYWSYCIAQYIERDDMDGLATMLVCAHQFNSVDDMRKAYLYLQEEARDFGYGLPTESILMYEEEKQWLVFVDCCDLPFALLVADYFGGQLIGWSDRYIECPPLPIRLDKASGQPSCKSNYLPMKKRRQIRDIKFLVQKHLQTSILGHNTDCKESLRSIYIFLREQDYNNAKDAIWYGNREIHSKLEWYGHSCSYGYDSAWVVKLYDNLTQEEIEWAVGRIREHGGQYYQC